MPIFGSPRRFGVTSRRCVGLSGWFTRSGRSPGHEQVLDYVGRYTHRVAISNNRLLSVDDAKVRFRWKDYRDGNRSKTMSLEGEEFIRRFLIHVLPDGFRRIRYFGFLANPHRAAKLALCRRLLPISSTQPATDTPGPETGSLHRPFTVSAHARTAPPASWRSSASSRAPADAIRHLTPHDPDADVRPKCSIGRPTRDAGARPTWVPSGAPEDVAIWFRAPRRPAMPCMPSRPAAGIHNRGSPSDASAVQRPWPRRRGSGLVQQVFRTLAPISTAGSPERLVRRASERKSLYVINSKSRE